MTDRTPIDYASSETGADAPRRPRPFLATPIGWPLLLFTAFFCVMALVSVRNGSSALIGIIPGLLCPGVFVAGAIVAWIVRCVARYDLVGGRPRAPADDRRIGWEGVAVPCLVAITAIVIYFDLHTRTMFECSRARFNAAVAAAPPGTLPTRGSYGLYHVKRVIRSGNGNVFFVLDDVGFMDPRYIGFEYAPTGLPKHPQPNMPGRIDLGGGWYWNYAFEG